MSNAKLGDRQESSDRCSRPTEGAVLKLLFTLFDYYTDYFSYYTHYNCISKLRTAFRFSIHCGNPPPWVPEAAQKQQIILLLEQKQQIILNPPQPKCPAQRMDQLLHLSPDTCSCCMEANQHAWLDETERPIHQPPGLWWYACPVTRDPQDPIRYQT